MSLMNDVDRSFALLLKDGNLSSLSSTMVLRAIGGAVNELVQDTGCSNGEFLSTFY